MTASGSPSCSSTGSSARASCRPLPSASSGTSRATARFIQGRTRHTNRLQKVLEDSGIKLAAVASRLLGASGRAMLDALVAGTTDPAILADLARGRLRQKLPALRQALTGRFRAHHAILAPTMTTAVTPSEYAAGRPDASNAKAIA